jgi:4-oxalocrotonate tautomerase
MIRRANLIQVNRVYLNYEVNDSLVRILGKKPEHTHIIIQETAEDNWGFVEETAVIRG